MLTVNTFFILACACVYLYLHVCALAYTHVYACRSQRLTSGSFLGHSSSDTLRYLS